MRTITYCFCGLIISCGNTVPSQPDSSISMDTKLHVDTLKVDLKSRVDVLSVDIFSADLTSTTTDMNKPEEPPHPPRGTCSNCHK